MSDDDAYLVDMLNAVRQALEYVGGVDKDAFLRNRMMQDAVVRQLEILGEAASRVSEGVRTAHPEIDWSGPVSLRNVLIHQYRRINLDRVWETIESDLPGLASGLQQLVPEEP